MTQNTELVQAIADAYDDTPYESNAFALTAPGHLRAVAALYGLSAPAVENARVLELGCAAGGNLLPFAVAHPNAHALGIDLSTQQIESGQAVVKAMGLRNLELRAMSITDITKDLGQFDYIIAHGVFSWVPPEVREAILRVCRENLAPEGIAYISYNTYPGWKASDVVRDAMILNSYGAQTPQERLTRAKDVLGMLEHGLFHGNPLRSALQQAVKQLRNHSDYYLMHEHLEAVNSPCYFLEFAAAAQQAGLAYLADAEPQSMMASNYGDNVAVMHSALSADSPREMREQYLDFAVGRQFRKSMLVHVERAKDILNAPEVNVFKNMHFGARLTPASTPAGAPSKERHYRTQSGIGIGTSEPSFVAVAEALRNAWPSALSFARLTEVASPKVKKSTTPAELSELVMNHLVTLLNVSALLLRMEAPSYEASHGKPQWIPGVAALRKLGNGKTLPVGHYNLWHQHVRLPVDGISQFVIRHIDDSASLADLRTRLRDALANGEVPHPDGKSLKRVRNLEPVAQTLLTSALNFLRAQGLLI
ncbi:class I SAM-dependent methyltransferase [Achromobacter sp.]|uniref:class I SAM-dependent methyltransferase n=1 Tax=Achromobacter sp. TaxID=134375 RepID=UPI0031D1CD40